MVSIAEFTSYVPEPNEATLLFGHNYEVPRPIYHRPRTYNPTVGRFNRIDPFEGIVDTPISLNKYIYGEANPILHTDPSGLAVVLLDVGLSKLISDRIRAADAARVGAGRTAAVRGVSRTQILRLQQFGRSATIQPTRLRTHITPRHVNQLPQYRLGGANPKSRFASSNPSKVQNLIQRTLNNPTTITQNTAGRPGFIYTRNFQSTVGYNSAGQPVTAVRVVVRPNLNVNTAFPVTFP